METCSIGPFHPILNHHGRNSSTPEPKSLAGWKASTTGTKTRPVRGWAYTLPLHPLSPLPQSGGSSSFSPSHLCLHTHLWLFLVFHPNLAAAEHPLLVHRNMYHWPKGPNDPVSQTLKTIKQQEGEKVFGVLLLILLGSLQDLFWEGEEVAQGPADQIPQTQQFWQPS